MEKQQFLVLLDLSADFDTLDHSEVNWYGISGNALRRLASHLVDLTKQSMVFPRDLSLGRSFSHSIQHQIKQRFNCLEQNYIEKNL